MIRLLVSPKTWLPNSTSVTSTEICGNKNEKQKCQETSDEFKFLNWNGKSLKYFIHMMSVQRVKQNDERTAGPNASSIEGVLPIEAPLFKNINTTPMKGFLRPPALSNFINFFQRFTLVSPASRFTNVLFTNLWSRFAYVLGQFPNSAFAWSVAERTRYIHAYRTFLYHAWEKEA